MIYRVWATDNEQLEPAIAAWDRLAWSSYQRWEHKPNIVISPSKEAKKARQTSCLVDSLMFLLSFLLNHHHCGTDSFIDERNNGVSRVSDVAVDFCWLTDTQMIRQPQAVYDWIHRIEALVIVGAMIQMRSSEQSRSSIKRRTSILQVAFISPQMKLLIRYSKSNSQRCGRLT